MKQHVHRRRRQGRQDEGQVLVIAAGAMIAIIALIALVLEGGNAYAEQRHAQNGADAAANAGATVSPSGSPTPRSATPRSQRPSPRLQVRTASPTRSATTRTSPESISTPQVPLSPTRPRRRR